MSQPLPEPFELEKPSAARMYDYFLGGFHNFAVDRAAADQAIAICPDVPLFMRANRSFLRRAVTFLVTQGITQFLDIGSGIPTVGNVHEIAQSGNPAARVVYVDYDPVAVNHSKQILEGNAGACIIKADARDTAALLAHPTLRSFLDFTRPMAVLLVAFLHFIPDDAVAAAIVSTVRQSLPAGSYLVLSHATADEIPAATARQLERLYSTTANPAKPRSREEVSRFFEGFELLEPGLVFAPLWRPESPGDLLLDQPGRSGTCAGVGRLVSAEAS